MSKYKASDLEKNWGKDLERRGVFNETKREGECGICGLDEFGRHYYWCSKSTHKDADISSCKHGLPISACYKCSPTQPKENKCDCPCHTSKSSSEDMKKNGCDLCYCDSEYYPRHPKSQPNIEEVIKEYRKEFQPFPWSEDLYRPFFERIIRQAFERTRPKEKTCVGTPELGYPWPEKDEGYNQCLSELKSNEEEYLR
jgi:hypothetical protein